MVWDRGILETFKSRVSTIGQAEQGRCIQAVGIGALRGTFEWNGKVTRINLKDVLVIPSLSLNIISVAKLSAHNLKVVFAEDHCGIL